MKEHRQRILLIEPPFYRLFKNTYSLDRYPLALGYLAGAIRKETDWDVVAYNSDFHPGSEMVKLRYVAGAGFDNYLRNLKDLSGPVWKEIESSLREYRPDVIGISAKSQNFASACMVAGLARQVHKQIIVIVGGPHPSMVGGDILNCPDIDVAVKGEGEDTIVELLKAIESGRKFDDIQGIIYRSNGRIVENAPREFINYLDSLCFPHENAPEILKDYKQYPLTAFRNIFATRGCPYNCFFCGSRKIWSRRVRFRSPENVVREIKLLQNIGLRAIHFDDDTFGVNKEYINSLCNAIILNCPGLKWSCELHVRLVDEQTIALMKSVGCYSIQIGIESGNDKILKDIRKTITIDQAVSACKIIKEYGIELEAFFMVGFPQETEDTLNDTITAIRRIESDDLICSVFTPYPGTEAFEFCRQKGLVGEDYDVSLYNHHSPANHFCVNINRKRFRMLVAEIEKMIDRKRRAKRIRQVFSEKTLIKTRELGIRKSFRKGIKLLVGK